jgi:hypothetical protein
MPLIFRALLACALLSSLTVTVGAQTSPKTAAPTSKELLGPNNFPIAVWLQSPENAAKYEKAGFNVYVGLWQGPTDPQLAALRAAHMPVICDQNAVGLAHKNDPTIIGWMHQDEPDNAQPITDPKTGKTTYGPCVPPEQIVAEYNRFRAADPTRPVMLNLGQGVANDAWVGRGSGTSLNDYKTYVQGADIISFDIYPVASLGKDGPNLLWYVPKGVDRLVGWTQGQKPIWTCIECTHISDPNAKPTPAQVRAEVWMALIHGSRGLIYFVHQFAPHFDEHALLDDPTMLAAVTAINQQIHTLAPVLNSPTLADAATAASSNRQCPVDIMVKKHGGATYLFAVGMRNAATTGTFAVQGLVRNATVTVIGEDRTLPIHNGQFTDTFAPYAVHIYQIR